MYFLVILLPEYSGAYYHPPEVQTISCTWNYMFLLWQSCIWQGTKSVTGDLILIRQKRICKGQIENRCIEQLEDLSLKLLCYFRYISSGLFWRHPRKSSDHQELLTGQDFKCIVDLPLSARYQPDIKPYCGDLGK